MDITTSGFQANIELFRVHALPILMRSNEYKISPERLPEFLLLADRILTAFNGDLEFGRVDRVYMHLRKLNQNTVNTSSEEVEALVLATEQWMKTILWLVYPEKWTILNQNKKSFTLFPTIRDLELLTQHEIDKDIRNQHEITDEAKRQVFLVCRRDRNFITHETAEQLPHIEAQYIHVALVALLVPVIKHYALLRDNLKGLFTRSIDDPQVLALLPLIQSEQRQHVERFKGREKWINELRDRLLISESTPGQYLLIAGYEGIGKSALCAKLAEVLAQSVYLGQDSSIARKNAPWLPNVILHSGKQSYRPEEIVRSLISQLNTLLLNPVEIANLEDYSEHIYLPPTHSGSSVQLSLSDVDLHSRKTRNQAIFQSRIADDDSKALTYSQGIVNSSRMQFVDLEVLRRQLTIALGKVVVERGSIVVIIDALDEISADGKNLYFLPTHLPSGVSVLLSARQNKKVVDWVRNNLNAEVIPLKGLELHEIPLFTGIEEGERLRFNDTLHRASQGWPVLVVATAKQIIEDSVDISEIDMYRSVENLFERQAKEWVSALGSEAQNIMREFLILLAIFEPIAPLDIDLLQSFLSHKGLNVSLSDTRDILGIVGAKLEGLEIGKVKLGLRAFADYIRNRYCSRKDLRENLEIITKWMADEELLDAKIVSLFLQYWLVSGEITDDSMRKTVGAFLIKLVSQRNADYLYHVYRNSLNDVTPISKIPNFAVDCLRASADQGHSRASLVLGRRLIDGASIIQDKECGYEILRRSADTGYVNSMIELGIRLTKGIGLDKDTILGEDWLRRAAEKENPDARGFLATFLINNGSELQISEGEGLLRELADEGIHKASYLLAVYLITSKKGEEQRSEGEFLLRQLAIEGYDNAIGYLADQLFNGDKIAANTDEAYQLYMQLINKGNVKAMTALSAKLFSGAGIEKDAVTGEHWLRKAIQAGSTDAMYVLGMRLIHGDGLKKDLYEGRRLLENAAKSDDFSAMITLARYILDGILEPQHKGEGETWLRKAAVAGKVEAMARLGTYLMDEDGSSQRKKEGEKWLRKASDLNYPSAMRALGNRLLHGKNIKRSIEEGIKWLEKAVDSGERKAILTFAIRLIKGDMIPQDIPRGYNLLIELAQGDDVHAMIKLGVLLLDGDFMPQNTEEGLTWINKAVDLGSPHAMDTLSSRYFKGDTVPFDIANGCELLRKSASLENLRAMRILGLRLIDGNIFTKDVIEGENLLRKCVEDGDADAVCALGEAILDSKLPHCDFAEGESLLRKAADSGDPDVLAALGMRLKLGVGIKQDVTEGKRLLHRAVKEVHDSYNSSMIGSYCYMADEYLLASKALYHAFQHNHHEAAVSLVFMARRGELAPGFKLPPTPSLLERTLRHMDAVAVVNEILCIAKGYDYPKDWNKADRRMEELVKSGKPLFEAIYWWHDILAKRGDPEGYLIVGWLMRYGVINVPNESALSITMGLAITGGWDVPDWLITQKV
ncbi:SEL1-like repeat protein [Candidatus Chloroploca sp. M-50]|uniref:SEL1-like repeat protein n=1 Tax=Candidatus Chloroploca mongolica TaxID=2528176 RepID=A0ABS4DE36_9CHLR|nr:SEL1-like repeat protein [Candidatus Chloroploca mongolica]MBP1467704.1 SEL1-like repeat protein [Candidatus Chloroploca mongolica]